jgi:hypothetical protein
VIAIAGCLLALPLRASPVLPASPAWVEIPIDELRSRYDTLWAVSDVHGHLRELEQLLLASGLAARDGESVRWNSAMRRQLLVVEGDLIDVGEESVGTVLLIAELQEQAAESGSRVVVLLGNHEVGFLANPRSASRSLLASARSPSSNLDPPRRMTGEELSDTRFGKFLRTNPVAAVIGTWLFAHSGYIDSDGSAAETNAYFARLDAAMAKADYGLLERSSILEKHNWWKSRGKRKEMRKLLQNIGLNGLVFGHDPKALGADGTLAIDREGWLMKLDTGLKVGRSSGMLLRCDVAAIAQDKQLVMSHEGTSTCRAMEVDGSLHHLPVE